MTNTTETERSAERKQFLLNIMVTAIEGGINYWAVTDKYHWGKHTPEGDFIGDDLDGFFAVVHEIDENGEGEARDRLGFPFNYDTTELRVDADSIARGIGLFKRYCAGDIDYHGELIPQPPIEDQEAWDNRGLRDGHYWHQFLVANRTNGDEGDYDAGVADTIVQFGLFGEVRYGG